MQFQDSGFGNESAVAGGFDLFDSAEVVVQAPVVYDDGCDWTEEERQLIREAEGA